MYSRSEVIAEVRKRCGQHFSRGRINILIDEYAVERGIYRGRRSHGPQEFPAEILDWFMTVAQAERNKFPALTTAIRHDESANPHKPEQVEKVTREPEKVTRARERGDNNDKEDRPIVGWRQQGLIRVPIYGPPKPQ